MDLPHLPTDNLYKFMALSGLALIIFSTAVPIVRLGELDLKRAEVEGEQTVLEVELEELKRDISLLEKKVKPSSQDLDAFRKRAVELRIKNAQFKGKTEQYRTLVSALQLAWSILKYGNTIGVAVAAAGFLLWYRQIQRPNDALLKRQLRG